MLDAGKILVNTLMRRMRVPSAAALILALALPAVAHDIPADVTVNAFVKPDGQRLHLVIRVPLKAMSEVDVPRRSGGFLDLARVDAALHNAATLWLSDNIELYEGDMRLASPRAVETRVSLESDPSFRSYDEALAHVTGPRLPNDTQLFWEQGLLDVLFEYPIGSERAEFSIRPKLDRLGSKVRVALRFLPPGGETRAFEFSGDPGLVRLDPRWYQAALRFVESGFFHILEGTDHLLFLLCLVVPFRRLVPLIMVVTSFTVAHSVTLIASAYDLGPDALWFPPLIETLIAVSHGFGFSFALRQQLQFAGAHLLTSLLSFNIGVELGQVLVLLLLVPLLDLLFRFVLAERIGTIVLSVLVGHTAWHWMMERGERLGRFPWPELGAAQLASAARWLMLVLILAALLRLAFGVLRRRVEPGRKPDPDRSAV